MYRSNGVTRSFRPIIALPDRHASLLSFVNLVEAHILDALRREHEVPLQKVRKAINYLFVDRSLGNKVVANALRLAGARVEIHDDHYYSPGPPEK
jgi:hypothetical protein